jgi:hypothetical protein
MGASTHRYDKYMPKVPIANDESGAYATSPHKGQEDDYESLLQCGNLCPCFLRSLQKLLNLSHSAFSASYWIPISRRTYASSVSARVSLSNSAMARSIVALFGAAGAVVDVAAALKATGVGLTAEIRRPGVIGLLSLGKGTFDDGAARRLGLCSTGTGCIEPPRAEVERVGLAGAAVIRPGVPSAGGGRDAAIGRDGLAMTTSSVRFAFALELELVPFLFTAPNTGRPSAGLVGLGCR